MERKLRYVWWFVIIGLVILAIWRLFYLMAPMPIFKKRFQAERSLFMWPEQLRNRGLFI